MLLRLSDQRLPSHGADLMFAPRRSPDPGAIPARPGALFDETFEEVFDHSPGGMLLAESTGSRPGRLTRVNAALCRITGYSRRQLLTMSLTDLTHPAHLAAHRRRLTELVGGLHTRSAAQRRWIRADGRVIWVQFNVSTVSTVGGDQRYLVGMVDDITDRVQRDHRLHHGTWYDPVTGLPNSALAADRISHALEARARTEHPVALLHVQLDGLEICRDVFGPAVADELVMLAGRRVVESVRPGDTVARGGPSHFLVVCPDFAPAPTGREVSTPDALDALVERLREVLDAPCQIGGMVHHLSARVGRTTSDAGHHVPDLLDLLERSLPAPPTAPDPGRTTGDFRAAPALLGTAAATRHVDLENELLRALHDDELVMFGQPVITMATGRIGAVEMLLRWRHPSRGLLGPADFLDVAEASPLMDLLGRRVLRESCRIAASWRVPPGAELPAVFVNVSGRQLESGGLSHEVFAALRESGLAANRLVLELTETCAPLIGGAVLADLAILRERGVRLAIDDVGTGYSTLARLTELPVDLLKIDRTFVVGMGRPGSADAVVRAIMEISRALDIPVVAEGIETVEQAGAVAGYGCDAGQGFYFSRPCPEAELARRLAAPAEVAPSCTGTAG